MNFMYRKSYIDQLPVGLLAQLVECCTSIAEVMGLNPKYALRAAPLFLPPVLIGSSLQ